MLQLPDPLFVEVDVLVAQPGVDVRFKALQGIEFPSTDRRFQIGDPVNMGGEGGFPSRDQRL